MIDSDIMNLRKAIAVRLVQTFGFDRERHVRFPWAAADGPVYYIVRRSLNWGDAGFFSNWLYALTHVAYAKEKGWIPVIDMRNYRTLYSEDHPVNGTRNGRKVLVRLCHREHSVCVDHHRIHSQKIKVG